jgi:hypothetical protein
LLLHILYIICLFYNYDLLALPNVYEYKSHSDLVPDGSTPTDYPTVEDVTDDEDEPEAGPPPKRLCNPPPPGM